MDDDYLGHLRADASKAAGVHTLITAAMAGLDRGSVDGALARRRASARVELVQGLLWNASVIIVDELFEDLEELRRAARELGPQPLTVAGTVHDSLVLSGLPRRFAECYDAAFTLRFIAASIVVTARIGTGWRYPATIAEELSTRLLLDRVALLIRNHVLTIDDNWRPRLEEALFEGADHELLYAENGGRDFDEWFTPLRDPPGTAPYATRDSF